MVPATPGHLSQQTCCGLLRDPIERAEKAGKGCSMTMQEHMDSKARLSSPEEREGVGCGRGAGQREEPVPAVMRNPDQVKAS